MKLKFETENCAHCPCLRNNRYGEFTCFFNEGRVFDSYYLNEIDDDCPLLEDSTKK